MKANEFIKEYGWYEAQEVVMICDYGYGIDLQELDRLVSSWELVDSFKCKRYSGLGNAKNHVLTLALIGEYDKMNQLQQAIEDVESCQ